MKSQLKIKTTFCLLLVLLSATQLSAQSTLRVPADFATIQSAIVAASDGDTVLVAPGTYVESISFLGKAIHVMSESGPEATTIDANQQGSVVLIIDGEGPDSILEGFTLTGGTGTEVNNGPSVDTFGGGIIVFESGPTIRGNVITGNTVAPETLGGGIACLVSDALLENNTVSMNLGGGIYVTAGTEPTAIIGNTVDGNLGGEGIQVISAASGLVEDNLVINNGQDGIDMSSLDIAIASRNVVMMNGTEGTGEDGIRITSCDVAEVCGNQIFAHESDGIDVRSSGIATITDNYAEGCEDTGILVFVVDQAFVARNFVGANPGTGMVLRNVDDLTCNDNVAVHNENGGIQVRSSIAIVSGITAVANTGVGFISSGNDVPVEISNSIFRDNSGAQLDDNLFGEVPIVNNCNVQGGFDGVGNIDVDPMFVSPAGPDGDPSTVGDNDYRLSPGSPCIDTGDSSNLLCTDLDIQRSPRLLDGLLDGNAITDMGAYEFNNVSLSVIDDAVPGGTVNVVTTGTAGMSVEILVGIAAAEGCTAFGPLYLDEATAVTFGPLTSPVDMQIELPAGSGQFWIQARAIDSTGTAGNTSNLVMLEFEVEFLLGDVNRDGAVNLLDVQPFVDLLSSSDFQAEADTNGDGAVNLLDVASFIDLLSN